MTGPKAIFVSHGSPMIALDTSSASQFLAELGRALPPPRAIVVASGHWRAPGWRVGNHPHPETIHDFFGFPPQLYAMTYPAPGAPDLARRIAELTGAELDAGRGYDHGMWIVGRLMWPDAEIPMVPLSLARHGGPTDHLALGKALRPLTEDGVLILGSGAATHNLSLFAGQPRDVPASPKVRAFTDWLARAVENDDRAGLANYRSQAPHAVDNHPTDEHLMPFFVAAGAGQGAGRVLHRSVEHGVIAMDAYAWD